MFPRVSLTVKTCPECPARITTPIQLPEVLLPGNARDEEFVAPASLLACCISTVVTVKATPLLANLSTGPPTVTTTLPLVAPNGTGTTMLVSLQLVHVPGIPLNVTVLAPTDAPKFVPVIVTEVPLGPDVGLRFVIVGVTTKFAGLLGIAATVTTMPPVVAPAGTGAEMLVSLQIVGLAVIPLKVSVLEHCVVPKPVPVIVTGVPIGPLSGAHPVITGPAGVVTLRIFE